MRDPRRKKLTIAALTMAIHQQKPPPGLVHHSDRGSQYAAADYRKVLDATGMIQSLSRNGNCLDQAWQPDHKRCHNPHHRLTACIFPFGLPLNSNQGLLNNRLGGIGLVRGKKSNPGPSGEDAAITSANLAMSDHRPAPGARLDRADVTATVR